MGVLLTRARPAGSAPITRERDQLTAQLREHIVRRAINDDDVNKLEQLIRYLSVDLILRTGETLLTFAITQGRWSLVQLLLQKGATINLPDATGSKPLQVAIVQGDVALVRLLVEHGADLKRPDISGNNALQLACTKGLRTISEVLLRAGADPNTINNVKDKKTPLIIAASSGNVDCVEALLCGGANPNAKDMWGFTALSKATINKHRPCVQVLLKHSANPDLGNRSGASPLQYAALRNHCDILKILLDHRASVSKFSADIPPLTAAVLNGCSECTLNLLQAGSDMAVIDKQRKVPLYNALADPPKIQHLFKDYPLTQTEDRIDCVRLLLDHGADVHVAWRSHFWELRHRSCKQLTSYKLLIRATGLNRINSTLTRSFFHKLAILGCADVLWMFCSAGYKPTDQELSQMMTWTSGDVCPFCLEMYGRSLTETCHKISCQDYIGLMKSLRSSPRSLKQISRVRIRSLLHRNVTYLCGRLPLSDDLKKFVTLDGRNEYMQLV